MSMEHPTSPPPVPPQTPHDQENVRAVPVHGLHGDTWHGEFWIEPQAGRFSEWQTVTNDAGEPIAYASHEAALAGAELQRNCRLYEARRTPAPTTLPQPTVATPKPKRAKPKSRPERWSEAASDAAAALSEIEDALTRFTSAMEDLRSVQEEYEEAKDNMPENLASSPYGEKLQTICDIAIEDAGEAIQSAIDEARGVIEEAEGADFPLGFGRD